MIEYLALTDGTIAIIDARHFDRISQFNWTHGKGRIYRSIGYNRKSVSLSQEIKKDYDSLYDHKNRNYLNNMEINLRPVSFTENVYNRLYSKVGCTSKFRGVTKISSGYMARIYKDSKCVHIGSFLSEVDAALAYNKVAIELYGEFAILNQIT